MLSLVPTLLSSQESAAHRHLHSFPTRRSSDLAMVVVPNVKLTVPGAVRLVLASRLKLEEIGRVHVLTTVTRPLRMLLLPSEAKRREPARTSTGPVLVNVTPVVETRN